MAITANGTAPYTSPATLISLLKRYRERGLQTPLTMEVLERAGVTKSMASRTFQALQILGLITDDGQPTDALEGLRLAPEDEYQETLADIIRGAYVEVFSFVDPAVDDPVQVRDAFRSYTPHGQQSRMVTLFLGLCEEAGIIAEAPKRISKPKSSKTDHPSRPLPKKLKRASRSGSGGSSNFQGSLPPPIAGLLSALPSHGESWTKETRDQFVQTFEVVLDFCIPIREKQESDASPDGEGKD